MAQDTVDAVIRCKSVDTSKIPTSEPLNSEMSGYVNSKAKGRRVIKCLINRLRLKRYASADISEPDPTYKVAYLGNVVTGWAKGTLLSLRQTTTRLFPARRANYKCRVIFAQTTGCNPWGFWVWARGIVFKTKYVFSQTGALFRCWVIFHMPIITRKQFGENWNSTPRRHKNKTY